VNWFLIPLVAQNQSFQISIAGVNYMLTVYWNDSAMGGWMFNLADADTDTPLIAGAPFITGANLLAGLEYLGIGGSLVVYTNGDATAVPSYTNLGTESNLYFVTQADVN
jgi:hypothetical protein